MDVREKLVELQLQADIADNVSENTTQHREFTADFMMANGVTVQNLDGCEYCHGLPRSERDCFTMPNASKRDYDIVTIKFCPICGRKFPEPPKGENE